MELDQPSTVAKAVGSNNTQEFSVDLLNLYYSKSFHLCYPNSHIY